MRRKWIQRIANMSTKKRSVEVITGQKAEGDVDLTGAIKGTRAPRAAKPEVRGRSSENSVMFECPWCGAINHTEETRGATFYVCFACHRPMRPAIA
jgi:predicted RNA-binding Zn-ribbon protein involved in translation (DUF1610 family)